MIVNKAQIFEIFSSVQGEGLYIGERHLFIRFSSCNLSCQYCDTKEAFSLKKECRVEQTPGQRDFKTINNPISTADLLQITADLCKNKNLHSALSLTGGEPLLQIDFLLDFLPQIKKTGQLKIYLETNGTLPKHMEEIINYVDIVSMDIKLPKVTGLSSYFREHQQFMEEVSYSGTELFVKLPVNQDVTVKEVDEAAQLIGSINSTIPLIIQPINPIRIKAEQLLSFQAVAKRKLQNVRVIPQIHKYLNVL